MVRGLENVEKETEKKPLRVSVDGNGNVNKKEFYDAAIEKIKNSPLNRFVPHDKDKYQVDGSPESWANFAMRLVAVESNFNSYVTNPSDPGGSYGLFQWGYHYGINSTNWKNPLAQLDAFIEYAKTWTVEGGGYIFPPSGVEAKRAGSYGGFAAVFSTVRNDKVNGEYAKKIANSITE